MTGELRALDVDGHRLAYRVHGDGPPLVVLNVYRRGAVLQAPVLARTWRVFQIYPLGYGYSSRVPGYAGQALARQVLAVLDAHGADRFVVWGFSKGGAMAAVIARETPRAAGIVCGGYSLLHPPSPVLLRRLDRRLRADHPSRSLWWWVEQIDWASEVRAMTTPTFFYWGAGDGFAKGLRATRHLLGERTGFEFLEIPDRGHEAASDPALLVDVVIPAVNRWARHQGWLGDHGIR